MKVDLIVGLPGDTVASVRRGLRYLYDNGLYDDVQVFNLSILPGTAFRQEADELGLAFQPRPPYYALRTPTLAREELFGLMQEAEDLFGIEFDAQPPPVLTFDETDPTLPMCQVDLDRTPGHRLEGLDRWAQAFTIWLQSADFRATCGQAAACIRHVLDANPFTTLQVILDPLFAGNAAMLYQALPPSVLDALAGACQESPTYLDRYYALQPGRPNGAKRLIVVLPARCRQQLDKAWLAEITATATVVWTRSRGNADCASPLEAFKDAWVC